MDNNQNQMQEFQVTFSLKIVAIITSLLAILSYLLDFFKAGFLKMTGFEALEWVVEEELDMPQACILYAFICAIFAFLAVLGAMKEAAIGSLIGAIASFASAVLLVIGVSEDFDYVSVGVYAFIILSIITVFVSLSSYNKEK